MVDAYGDSQPAGLRMHMPPAAGSWPPRPAAAGSPLTPVGSVPAVDGSPLPPFEFLAPVPNFGSQPAQVPSTLTWPVGAAFPPPVTACQIFPFPAADAQDRDAPPAPLPAPAPATSGARALVRGRSPSASSDNSTAAAPRTRATGGPEVEPVEPAFAAAARVQQDTDDHESHAFMDPGLLSRFSSLIICIGTHNEVEARKDVDERPHRRPRVADPAQPLASTSPAGAEAAAGGAAPRPGPIQWLSSPDAAAMQLELGRAKRTHFAFNSRRQRGRLEDMFYAALQDLKAKLPNAPAALLEALQSGPILDTRVVSSLSGQRSLREAFLLLRAATSSVAAEQTAATHLVRASVCDMMYFSQSSPAELAAACERSWLLADALVPPGSAVTFDLSLVPLPQIVQLARLAVDLLEPSSEADPRTYAEALSNLGYRLLQVLEDEEARAVLYNAWSLVKRCNLSPCRAECRAIRGIAMSYARRGINDKAAEVAQHIYWFEDSREAPDVRIKAGCYDTIMRIAVGRRDWATEDSHLAAYRHFIAKGLNANDPDFENFEFAASAYHALSSFHHGRIVEFVGRYRKIIQLIQNRPPLVSSPLVDVYGSFSAAPIPARNLAAGLRLACIMQRMMDPRSTTPLLAHLLYQTACAYQRCGRADKAAAAYREALREYGRFPAVFPADHPRLLALRAALAACAPAESPPSPSAFSRFFASIFRSPSKSAATP